MIYTVAVHVLVAHGAHTVAGLTLVSELTWQTMVSELTWQTMVSELTWQTVVSELTWQRHFCQKTGKQGPTRHRPMALATP